MGIAIFSTKILNRNIFVLIGALVFFCFGCDSKNGRTETSTELYQRVNAQEGGNFFSVPPKIASIFLDDRQKGIPELKALLNDINDLSLLVIKNRDCQKESSAYSNLDRSLKHINFHDLAMVNNGCEIVKVKILKDGKRIDEMVVLVSNYNTLFCVSLKGNISSDKVAELARPENMTAVSNLNRFANQ